MFNGTLIGPILRRIETKQRIYEKFTRNVRVKSIGENIFKCKMRKRKRYLYFDADSCLIDGFFYFSSVVSLPRGPKLYNKTPSDRYRVCVCVSHVECGTTEKGEDATKWDWEEYKTKYDFDSSTQKKNRRENHLYFHNFFLLFLSSMRRNFLRNRPMINDFMADEHP